MHVNEVKLFLTAPTKEKLVTLMHDNNRVHGIGFQYSDPIKDGKLYVTWFKADILDYMNKETGRNK